MKLRIEFLIAAVLLTAIVCAAQTPTPPPTPAAPYSSKVDFSVLYVRQFNDLKFSDLSPSHLKPTFLSGLNGAAISGTFNLNPHFGLKTEFTAATQGGNFSTSGKNYSGMFGGVFRKPGRVSPYVAVLGGVSRQTAHGFGLNGGQTAFSAKGALGCDFMFSQRLGLRAEGAYRWTAYHTVRPNDLTVISSGQNNGDLGVGIVFKLGKR